MHMQNCVHRDLKPANILIKNWNPIHALVSDFDFLNTGGPLKHLCGSRIYIAPEIADAHVERDVELGFYNRKVDVWALGMIARKHGMQL